MRTFDFRARPLYFSQLPPKTHRSHMEPSENIRQRSDDFRIQDERAVWEIAAQNCTLASRLDCIDVTLYKQTQVFIYLMAWPVPTTLF